MFSCKVLGHSFVYEVLNSIQIAITHYWKTGTQYLGVMTKLD